MVKPQRDLSYEFIRVVSMILIILAHEIPNYLGQFSRLGVYTELVTNVGVTLFFMLSGKFALELNIFIKNTTGKKSLGSSSQCWFTWPSKTGTSWSTTNISPLLQVSMCTTFSFLFLMALATWNTGSSLS